MPLLACGINHKTAPIAIRERVAFTPATTPDALQQLLQQGAANEAVILSTCNRTELYSYTQDPSMLHRWLAEHHQLSADYLAPHLYYHCDQAAIKHMLRVTSGLDSMILGEPQIFGQVKEAFTLAHQAGAVGKFMERLFQMVFSATKQIRTQTQIGASPISIAYSIINLAKQIFADITKSRILLIGAGDTIELIANYLTSLGVKRIVIANRSLENAQELAAKLQAHAITMGDIPVYLSQTDIVISATASELPILGKGTIESALKTGKRRPLLLVDLAVPRDIEPQVSELEDAYLYNIDDLQKIIHSNLSSRQEAAALAESMIDIQAAHFMRDLQSLNAVEIIRTYRERIACIQEQELQYALQKLHNGATAENVLQELSQALVNKIMHAPTQQLKQAAYDGRVDLLLVAKQLLIVE